MRNLSSPSQRFPDASHHGTSPNTYRTVRDRPQRRCPGMPHRPMPARQFVARSASDTPLFFFFQSRIAPRITSSPCRCPHSRGSLSATTIQELSPGHHSLLSSTGSYQRETNSEVMQYSRPLPSLRACSRFEVQACMLPQRWLLLDDFRRRAQVATAYRH
jgi:hypothetical protein